VNSDAEGLPLDGALAYASGEALVVQRVNLETLALEGPSPLLGSPIGRGTEHELYATAGAELLLFGIPASSARELRWVDRVGVATGTLGEPMNASDVRIAPDGRRIAVARVDPQLRTLDIWAYDDQRPVPRRLSPNIDADESPAWSRDGRRVAWVSGRRTVTTRDSGAARADVMVHKFEHAVRVTDWSPDGRWIVVSESRPETRADIIVLSAASTPSAATRPYAQTPFNETYGTVSPDGRWLAYASDESGHVDVYVDTFPTPGRRARLSVGGGTEPRWSNDGTQVFFRRGSEVHVVHLRSSDDAQEAMSSERLFNAGGEIRSFDVTPDGRRFLLNVPIPDAAARAITAIVNVRSALPAP
jgi:Tol biopolymer transport system component